MDTAIRREPVDGNGLAVNYFNITTTNLHASQLIEQNSDALIEFSYKGIIYAVSACIERGDDINKVLLKPIYASHVRNAFGQIVPNEKYNTDDSNNLEPFLLKSGDTALIAAIKRDHVDIIRLLLENGANVAIESNYISTVPCGMRLSGLTPLMCAAARCDLSVEILDMLLAHNANINYQNGKGLTALMYSCQLGKAASTKYLIAHGADMELKDKREFNALMCACVTNQVEIIDILLENGAILSPQCFLLTVQYGHYDLVLKFVKILGKNCLNYKVDSLGINNCEIGTNHHLPAALGDTALIIATRRDFKEIVKLLIDLGADTTVCNSLGVNALNLVVECSMMDIFLAYGAAPSASSGIAIKLPGELLIDAVRCRNLNVIRYYHSHGGDVNYEPPPIIKSLCRYTSRTAEIRQDSALAMACRHSYMNVVNLLIHFNAKITPEVWRRAVTYGHEAIVKRLIIAGVDFDQQDEFGKTALIEATYAGRMKVVEVLLAAGANLEIKNMFDMTALHMSFRYNDAKLTKLLLESGADVHAMNSRGETPLMEALFNNNLAVVHALLDGGSDVNRQNFIGNTALMFAILQECNLNIIWTLLAHGADVNLANDFGETALIMAAKLNNMKLVNLLVRAAGPACINAQDQWGKTACTYASGCNNFQMVKLLLLNNADASIGIGDSADLFKELCDNTRPAALELHRKESNWRNRKSFIIFLSENSYVERAGMEDQFLHSTPSHLEMSEAASARPISGGAAGGACDGESAFICNICLDITDKEPVVTQCGHLYCWTCLYRWLNTNHTTCPVCKAGITQENIIPLFIRGENQDPRKIGTNVNNNTDNTEGDAVPNRPQGRRPEPTAGAATGNNMNAQFGNMSFSVGFGFFPSLFGLQFQNFTPVQPQTGRPLTPEEIEQQKLSRVLMGIGIIVLSALLFL